MMLTSSFLVCILGFFIGYSHLGSADSDETKLFKSLMQNYDKNEPPNQDKGTKVQLGVYINSLDSINEQTMDYSVSMYFRQSWNDPRLEFSSINSSMRKIRMPENSWNDIWIPDTFFRNEKASSFHEVTVKNRLPLLSSAGDVWYVTKISAVFSCPMNLKTYPFDTQSCPMIFESFGYTMDTMYFAWMDTPVHIGGLKLPQFTLVKTIHRDCSQNLTGGAYPCLEILFTLKRDIGYFIVQVYVPSILIVMLSWASFWINVDASAARVSIGLLTVLITTMVGGEARATLPRVSYIKAIDVWMITCFLYVFTSLIEYAVVNVLARRQDHTPAWFTTRWMPFRWWRKGTDEGGRQGTYPLVEEGMVEGKNQENDMANGLKTDNEVVDGKFQAKRVDKFSRLFFPLSFILFNLVYWSVYASPSGSDPDDVNLSEPDVGFD